MNRNKGILGNSLGSNQELFPGIDADPVSLACGIARQEILRLDIIAQLLRELTPTQIYGPDLYLGRLVDLMKLDLASMPADHTTVVVGNAPQLLVANLYGGPMPYIVTNLDNAQLLFYGTGDVSVTSGPVIGPNESEKIIVPVNYRLHGIVAGANINVALSRLALP